MIDFTAITKFFETELPLHENGLDELYALFKETSYKKGSVLIQENTQARELRFLNEGVVREYYTTEQKEININFYTKPVFISDLLALSQNKPTRKNQDCISEVKILSIDKQPFFDLLKKYECGNAAIQASFQRTLKQKELLEYNRVTKTPDELYQELLIYKPEWLQQIPQYHIASYLNISPETLSRIRKRIS